MKNNINHLLLFVTAASVLIMPSCNQKEIMPDVKNDTALSFSLGEITRSATSCDVVSDLLPLGMDIENAQEIALATSFRLNIEESALGAESAYAEESMLTRGTPAYTENLGDFIACAYEPLAATGNYVTKYLSDATFTRNEGTNVWSHRFVTDVNWPSTGLRFFMRYPAGQPSEGWSYKYAGGKNIITKTGYTTPGSGSDVHNAAELQKDVVFATEQVSESMAKNPVGILFYHPFAGVKFKLSEIPEGMTIKSITLGNVYGSGDCTITPYYGNTAVYNKNNSNADGADETKSKTCTSWTNLGTPSSFEQTFETSEVGNNNLNGNLFPAGFAEAGSTQPNKNQINDASLSKTFILIPQTFTADHKLTIVIKLKYNDLDIVRTAEVASATWSAGSLYTYTIKFNSEIDVTVTDEVNDGVKSNVVIKNTGNVPEYIRAAIVGNWYNAAGQIVAAWDMNNETAYFVGLPGADWKKSGNYYYCTEKVEPGEATSSALFTSYTQPTPPVAGAHLEIRIMVQAIIADDTVAQTAWNVKPSELN